MSPFVLLTVIAFVIAVALFILSVQLAKRSGLPHGKVIYSDTGAWQRNEQPLFSLTNRIVGKPDYLVRQIS